MKKIYIFLCTGSFLLACSACRKVPGKDYRAEMRGFVQEISAYARSQRPGFIIIPQNGQELISLNGDTGGAPATDYLAAVDGCGREDLYFGYRKDDSPTPAEDNAYMLAWCRRWRDAGKSVLVTDYCSGIAHMQQSYDQNAQEQFISFAADERNLDHIPGWPSPPFHAHNGNVTNLAGARNFLYLINPGKFGSRQAFIQALQQSRHDLIIIDAFFNEEPYLPQEIASLKLKPGGGSRLLIAYMSIGEAENYRYYWKKGWRNGTPSFIYRKNPDWPGNYKVFYWDPEWKNIITGNPDSYTQKILDAGFDGVYLDIIDAFEYYENH